ncbi:phosphatidate cytidylyltransferase [Nitrincola alkalisediminis]|uniref:phosphatidate cytidylyltransferase n=1 Tax=Nitrincola alkalisediminis TaxID=1366656 RepID=UPI001876A49F|nr:phosphatidate cytidylyltransferase [Nitrincola alkalisediminis]
MLKQRLITGLILGVGILATVWWAPLWLFSLIVGAATVYGAWEWSNFCRFKPIGRIAYVVMLAVLILLLFVGMDDALAAIITISAVAFWLGALVLVLRYPSEIKWRARGHKLIIGMFVLIPAWLALVRLKEMPNGEMLILLLLLLVWGADTGAYFAGRALGKHKLMPNVSPGKTIEGFVGGLAVCMFIALSFSIWNELTGAALVYLVLLSIVTAMASVLGDLFESMFKRERGIKDSGTLLPGHGGVLDRIDSLTAAAPVFLFGLQMAPPF